MTSQVMDAWTANHGYGEVMETEEPPRVGLLLREWRRRRKLSQLDLALRADSSTRHLSCVETGRARPSREMVLRLAEHLDVRCATATACCWLPVTPPRTGSRRSTASG